MTSPEQIQQQIEATRDSLSADVNRLSDKVSPSAVVSRRVERVKGSVGALRDKVMGALPDPGQVQSAGSSVGSAAASAGEAVSNAPGAVRRQTEGSPLAAGLIAFGAGMLLAALLPPSQAEQDLASRAEHAARQKAQDLREPVQQKAQEVAGELKQSAQQSAEQVKQAATDAASDTADQARSRAEDVRQPLQG